MRAVQAVAIVAFLVLLLTFLSLRAINPEAELFDRALVELDHFAALEARLHRHVLTARTGVLRNYDPLVKGVNELRASLDRLRETAAIDVQTATAIDRLGASIDHQEELIESFKTDNALLHNSLAFFARRFRREPGSVELDPAIGAAATAILRLTLDTSSAAANEVHDRLEDLDQQADRSGRGTAVDALLAHGRLLQRLLPAVDDTLKAMRALPQQEEQNALRALIVHREQASRDAARWSRQLLYATSLVLVAFLVDLGIRLKSRANALRRRAAFEHVLTGISLRFISAGPQDLDAEIDAALAEMAACIGSDRAYFVMSGQPLRRHVWQRPGMRLPPGWPASAPQLAAQMGAGATGVVHVPCVWRMPIGLVKSRFMDLGLSGWACAAGTTKEGERVALGFDAVRRSCRIRTKGELALVRMALDSIVQAVERHEVERERARLEARLRQSRRMETIGTFTSGIAHNFNNILGGIVGHSEVMEEHVGDTRCADNLTAIRRSAERARDLVDQILVFGRRGDVRRKPVSLGALVAETTSLLDVSLPSGVDLVVREPPRTAIVSGENAQLQQVILNLCKNAALAMEKGGRIEIAIALHEVSERRSLSQGEIRPGQYACITVTDTGHGMDEATLGQIFEPFFTTRSSGNGLGLATVREIVLEHDGAMDVQSRPGQGSRFEVWLPCAPVESPPTPVPRPAGNGETVMLVAPDSERLLRDEEMLAALGYEPVGFAVLDMALAACRASPGRFDMAVVGHFGSPKCSLEVAALLHAALPRLPIVLATRAAIEIGADALVSAGISDVIRWPIVADELSLALAHGAALLEHGNERRVLAG